MQKLRTTIIQAVLANLFKLTTKKMEWFMGKLKKQIQFVYNNIFPQCRAVVQKYLLEKSRICSQGRNERNYHVFYYLLAGSSEAEKKSLHLKKIEDYNYLNRVNIPKVYSVRKLIEQLLE
jgi:myosin heavy subunit